MSGNPEGTRKIAGSAAASGAAQFRILARKCRMRRRACACGKKVWSS